MECLMCGHYGFDWDRPDCPACGTYYNDANGIEITPDMHKDAVSCRLLYEDI